MNMQLQVMLRWTLNIMQRISPFENFVEFLSKMIGLQCHGLQLSVPTKRVQYWCESGQWMATALYYIKSLKV